MLEIVYKSKYGCWLNYIGANLVVLWIKMDVEMGDVYHFYASENKILFLFLNNIDTCLARVFMSLCNITIILV